MDTLSLDSDQKKVVDYPDSCICIAGPGSGKTRVLVAKAESLYKENVDLVCLTFTRSAARTMKERIPGIPVQTIHSFCHGEVGWFGDYDQMLEKFQQLDLKPKYQWVLVDEAQDLTLDQLKVVQSIIGEKVFAVGDPYQSIYGFNGALGVQAIQKFRDFGCTEFFLRNNYRSNTPVVKLLNSIYHRDLVSTGVKETGITTILTRTNKDLREVQDFFNMEGLGYTITRGSRQSGERTIRNYGSTKLQLMTCHCSKGLEFDWVILYKWFPETRGEKDFIPGIPHSKIKLRLPQQESWGFNKEEQNLYYVSVSRASKGFCRVQTLKGVLDALRVTESDRISSFVEVP